MVLCPSHLRKSKTVLLLALFNFRSTQKTHEHDIMDLQMYTDNVRVNNCQWCGNVCMIYLCRTHNIITEYRKSQCDITVEAIVKIVSVTWYRWRYSFHFEHTRTHYLDEMMYVSNYKHFYSKLAAEGSLIWRSYSQCALDVGNAS
jgi:hypothetical protein